MSDHIGSLAGPDTWIKVNRVLDAARAWRPTVMGRCDHVHKCATCELKDAIDALDAPQERYYTSGYQVFDGRGRVATAETHCDAERIAAALNAADAREGK